MRSAPPDATPNISDHFPGTVLAKRSRIPLWLQQTLVASLFLIGSGFMASAVLQSSTSAAVSPLPWLGVLIGIVGWTGAVFLNLVPLHLVKVPDTIEVDGGGSVTVLDLSPVPGYPRYFTTPQGKLLLIDRRALRCRVSRAEYLPILTETPVGGPGRVQAWVAPRTAVDDWR